MPELPDVTVYIESLERRISGRALDGVRIASPFLLRSVARPCAESASAGFFASASASSLASMTTFFSSST